VLGTMKNYRGKSFTAISWCLLLFAATSAKATESLVCGNDTHSIQVLCSSEGCDSFNLYAGSVTQPVSTWQIVRSEIDEKNETIIFRATNPSRPADTIELRATRSKGTLRISNSSRRVKCDWSAFEL